MAALTSLFQSTGQGEPIVLKRLAVEDYHRMSELNLLVPNERTELLAGQITLRVAKGIAHVLFLRLMSQLLEALVRDETRFISTQYQYYWTIFQNPTRI